MKIVRIVDFVVVETIPPYATSPSIGYWYGREFAEQCMEVDDSVSERDTFDPVDKSFSKPISQERQLTVEQKIALLEDSNSNLREQNTILSTTLDTLMTEILPMLMP